MWNKYIKSNEKERKRLMTEFLTGLSVGCNVKTNEIHDSSFGISYSGIVGDINLKTGIIDVEIPIGHGQMMEIHRDWLERVN